MKITIEDPKVQEFVNMANKYTNEHGKHPDSIHDYCSIATQLCFEKKLSDDEYNHIIAVLTKQAPTA